MNRNEFRTKLTQANINPDTCSLDGGLPSEMYCLNQTLEGWEVYYSERGNKTNLKLFGSEEEALMYLYSLLTKISSALLDTGTS